jgi:hypothetical protein
MWLMCPSIGTDCLLTSSEAASLEAALLGKVLPL